MVIGAETDEALVVALRIGWHLKPGGLQRNGPQENCQIGGRFHVFSRVMGRSLGFVPEGVALMKVTSRALHGRYIVKHSPQLSEIVDGVLSMALI